MRIEAPCRLNSGMTVGARRQSFAPPITVHQVHSRPQELRMPCHLAAALAVVVGTFFFIAAESAEPQRDPSDAIAAQMEKYVAAGQIAGAVTLVASREGIVHHNAIGQADLESNRPMTPDTIFAVASMTKPITATAVMILVDEGKLSLDDPISKFIPEFRDVRLSDGSVPKRELTIRDVLTHTSGLAGDQRMNGSLEETVRQIAARPLAFQPGAKWQYSPGLTVAGRIVEIVADQPFEEFLATRIFQPLEMTDTTLVLSEDQRMRLAQLYQPAANGVGLEPAQNWIVDPSGHSQNGPNPSGGLFSTATDLARFYRMVLNGGEHGGQRIVSEMAVKEMTRLQTGELATGFTPGSGWGLGWCLVREPQGVTSMLSSGSFGHGGAFGTQGWVDPEQGLVFVLLIQRAGLPNSDASEIRRDFQHAAVQAYGTQR
jgi:CubicO group peptidase (beta-lactamase class C family)